MPFRFFFFLFFFFFHLFAAKRRHAKRRNDAIRKDEKSPCEKRIKRRNPQREKTKFQRENTKAPCEKMSFETFILSSFRVTSFCLFAGRLFT